MKESLFNIQRITQATRDAYIPRTCTSTNNRKRTKAQITERGGKRGRWCKVTHATVKTTINTQTMKREAPR